MRFITRNDFHRAVLRLTFAAALVSPAFAAETTSIPDLSGISGRWFNFEPPSSGPVAVVSKLRRSDGSIVHSVVGDFTNPILRPQTAEIVKNNGELELSGVVIPNPHNQYRPEPTPFALSIQRGIQIMRGKNEVTLQVRRVRMNVPHSDHPTPTWPCESAGHYDTLVIDTIGQKVGPLSRVDRFGTAFSGALQVIERYQLIDGTIARDLQLKCESAYFGPGRSSPGGAPTAGVTSTLTRSSRDCRSRSPLTTPPSLRRHGRAS